MHDTPASFLKTKEEAEADPDKRNLMDDLKADHNGEYYDGESDQDHEDGAEQETWKFESMLFVKIEWLNICVIK